MQQRIGAVLGISICLFTLIFAASASVGGEKKAKLKEPTTAQLKIAKAIAGGHAYEKHVVEEKLFPEIKSEAEFVELMGKVLANPTHHRELENDREAFYDKHSNTIIIYNPAPRTKEPAFVRGRPQIL